MVACINNNTDVGIAVTLIGGVGFMSFIAYLLNHSRPHIVKFSTRCISETMSIFAAVLLFQAINGLVVFHLDGGEDAPLERQLCLSVGQFFFTLLVYRLRWRCWLDVSRKE